MSYGKRKHDSVSHLSSHRVVSGNGFQRTAAGDMAPDQLKLGRMKRVDKGDCTVIVWVRADGTEHVQERVHKPLSALDVSAWR